MKDSITYGSLTAAPGTKVQGWFPVLDTDYKLPVTVINGMEEGKTVLLTSSIHGCEYPSIEAVFRIAEQIDPMQVVGQLIIINPVNVDGFLTRTPYILPQDGKNLNRLFPGNPEGTLGEKIAYVLTEEFQKKADFYIDTHGGDIPEHQNAHAYYPSVCKNEEIAKACALATEYILHADFIIKSASSNHAYNYAALWGIPSVMLELGEAGRWSEREVELYIENIENLLRYIGILPGTALKRIRPVSHIIMGEYLSADATGRWYPCVEKDEQIRTGQKLGEIRDLFGNVIKEYYAKNDSLVLMVTRSLAIKNGDPILTYGMRCTANDCNCFEHIH